jgi:hypothetical protein
MILRGERLKQAAKSKDLRGKLVAAGRIELPTYGL